jgi:hypothetical protein
MNRTIKIPLVNPDKMTGAKLKGTVAAVATLCIVCAVFIATLLASGCKERESSSTIDDATLLKNIDNAPVAIVPKGDLPEWLQAKIEYQWEHYVTNPIPKSWLVILRGEWNKHTFYHFWHALSSDNAEVYYEDGTKPSFFPNEIKNWVLIYKIFDGVVVEPGTKSAYSKTIEDKFKFPDISKMNDWWGNPDIQNSGHGAN